MTTTLANLLRTVAAAHRPATHGMAVCLIARAAGSAPQGVGALLFVAADGQTFGTIGGGCMEESLRRRALQALARGQSGLVRFQLDGTDGWDDGLICGGTVDVAVAPAPRRTNWRPSPPRSKPADPPS